MDILAVLPCPGLQLSLTLQGFVGSIFSSVVGLLFILLVVDLLKLLVCVGSD